MRDMLGIGFVCISIILSMFNLSFKFTGGVIGTSNIYTLLNILVCTFFLMGITIVGGLEKKLKGALLTALVVGSGGLLHYGAENNKNRIVKGRVYHWATAPRRFQRTYRWDDILDKKEEKYGIQKGLLKGLAMQESCGDPLKLSESEDGGAGIFMLMPGTAKEYGLKVFENNGSVSADTSYGKKLRKLVEKYNYDSGKLAKIDERFDVCKASEAAAKHLKRQYNIFKNWDKATSAYNRGAGNVARRPLETPHVKKVKGYQEYYNKHDKN